MEEDDKSPKTSSEAISALREELPSSPPSQEDGKSEIRGSRWYVGRLSFVAGIAFTIWFYLYKAIPKISVLDDEWAAIIVFVFLVSFMFYVIGDMLDIEMISPLEKIGKIIATTISAFRVDQPKK